MIPILRFPSATCILSVASGITTKLLLLAVYAESYKHSVHRYAT